MKKISLGLAIILAAGASFAANLASDNAADTAYSGGFTNGANGGYGFAAWVISLSSPGNSAVNGTFMGSSTGNADGLDDGTVGGVASDGDIDTTGTAWGMYANSSALTSAERGLTGGSLSVGQTILASFDNGFIGAGNTVGLSLWNSSGQNVWEIFFTGGNSTYTINDGSATAGTVGYGDEGVDVQFTLVSASTYDARIIRADGTSQVISGANLLSPAGGQGVDTIRFFNSSAGSGGTFNHYANSIEVVPEPSTLALAGLGLVGLLIARRRKA